VAAVNKDFVILAYSVLIQSCIQRDGRTDRETDRRHDDS